MAAKLPSRAPICIGRKKRRLPISEEKRFDQLTILSIAPLLAAAIKAVFDDGSVADLFDAGDH